MRLVLTRRRDYFILADGNLCTAPADEIGLRHDIPGRLQHEYKSKTRFLGDDLEMTLTLSGVGGRRKGLYLFTSHLYTIQIKIWQKYIILVKKYIF